MKKIFTLFVLALLAAVTMNAQLPSLTTVWDLSVNNGNTKPDYLYAYLWNSSQRSMAVKDGKIYITNNGGDKKIAKVDATTGALIEVMELSFLPEAGDRWLKNCIRITADGYAIVGSSGTGSSYMVFTIFNLEDKTLTGKVTVQMPGIGRCDFFDVYGKLYGEESEGGYIAVASNSGSATKIPMFGGTISTEAVTPFPIVIADFSGTSVVPAVKDADSFFVLGRSIQSRLCNMDGTQGLISSDLAPNNANSGGSFFKYNGKEYLVVATDNISAFRILDVTEGVANATIAMEGNFALGVTDNKASTVMTSIETEVKEDGTMIYVMSSNNGIAAYKFVTEKPVIQTVVTPVIQPEAGEYNENITITITTETPGTTIRYTLDGTDPTESSTEYTAPFELAKPEGLGDVTVKAKAWLAGWDASEVASVIYTFTTVGIGQEEVSALKVYSANGQIVVETEVAASVEIFNLQGQKVVSDKAVQSVNQYTLDRGIYIVKVQGKSIKVIL